MASGARKTRDNTAAFARIVQKLAGTRVLVGIPAEDADRIEDDGTRAPINNAAIGYILEKGSPAANIPARPFLVPGVEDSLDRSTDPIGKAGARALNGDEAGADRNFHAAGLIAQASVKQKMSSNVPPKLKESTLENRRRRGVTRTTTLVDTGNLQNHIQYVIRRKKK
jgi:hypothetical protein